MHPPDEFLKHAAECECMAKLARKPEDKVSWKGMAERWHRCAEIFSNRNLSARKNMPQRRPIPIGLT